MRLLPGVVFADGEVDEQFGFGTRYQDVRRDAERQAVELLAASEVGHGYAQCPPLNQAYESVDSIRHRRRIGAGEHGDA